MQNWDSRLKAQQRRSGILGGTFRTMLVSGMILGTVFGLPQSISWANQDILASITAKIRSGLSTECRANIDELTSSDRYSDAGFPKSCIPNSSRLLDSTITTGPSLTSLEAAVLYNELVPDGIDVIALLKGYFPKGTSTSKMGDFVRERFPSSWLSGEFGTVLAKIFPEEITGKDQEVSDQGVWTAFGANKLSKTDSGGEFDTLANSVMIGYDRKVTENILLGAAVGLERTDTEIKYNSGSVDGRGKSVNLYGGYTITPWLTADASLGYSWLDYDFVANTNVTSSTTGNRWNFGTNLTANYPFGPFGIFGGVGFRAFNEHKDDTTDSAGQPVSGGNSSTRMVVGKVGGFYLHQFPGFDARISANARLDHTLMQPSAAEIGNFGGGSVASRDLSSLVLGASIDLANKEHDLIFSLGGTTTRLKQNTSVHGITGKLRYKF